MLELIAILYMLLAVLAAILTPEPDRSMRGIISALFWPIYFFGYVLGLGLKRAHESI